MTALSPQARAALREAGVPVAAWTRHHFGPAATAWDGSACGCPDDRCAGRHHDQTEACGCLAALLPDVQSAPPQPPEPPIRTGGVGPGVGAAIELFIDCPNDACPHSRAMHNPPTSPGVAPTCRATNCSCAPQDLADEEWS